MNIMGESLIALFCVLLAVAVGGVLFSVRRIAFGIISQVRKRKPTRTLQHPELGRLMLEGDLWTGQAQGNGQTIQFVIAGTESGPDSALVERLRGALARLSELERLAVARIRNECPAVKGEFTPDSLDFLWEQRPDFFVIEFTLKGDADGIWRVEFEKGRPFSVGWDD